MDTNQDKLMKIFIGAISFVLSTIVAKIVFILIASPVLFIQAISKSSFIGGIIMSIAIIAGICAGIFCFIKSFGYFDKEFLK